MSDETKNDTKALHLFRLDDEGYVFSAEDFSDAPRVAVEYLLANDREALERIVEGAMIATPDDKRIKDDDGRDSGSAAEFATHVGRGFAYAFEP